VPFPVASSPYAGSNPNPAYSGVFIPEIWSGKFIQKFYDTTVLAAISNTEYEGEIKNYGDKVKMRQRPAITIRNYESHMGLIYERPSIGLVEMNIDQGKYFGMEIDDVLKKQMDVKITDEWAAEASEQMKIEIDRDVLVFLVNKAAVRNRGTGAGRISQNLNLGTNGAPVQLSRNNILDYIVFLGQVLDEQNVPETGRWIVMPAWAASLLKRSDLRDASLVGDSTSVMRNGRLGMVDRFTLYSSNLLPTSATDGVGGNDADGATYIYAGHKNALTFASQMTKLDVIRGESSFADRMRGLQVYGRQVVDPTAYAQLYAIPAAGAFTPPA
jgi:hypothetical protein